jgi:hypothetical protein
MAVEGPSASQRKLIRVLLSPEVKLDLAAALERCKVSLERYYVWLSDRAFVEFQREALRRYRLGLEPAVHAAIAKALDKPERWAVDLLIEMNGLGGKCVRDEGNCGADLEQLNRGKQDDGLSEYERLVRQVHRLVELVDTGFGPGAARRVGGDGDGPAGEAVPPPVA